jgi:hypothetical protein
MQDIINAIAQGYEGEEVLGVMGDYDNLTIKEKSLLLEDYLVGICNSLAEVNNITGKRNVDANFLLTVVGSYLMGIQAGEIIAESEAPRVLFEEALFPSLDKAGLAEVTKEDYDGEPSDTSDDEVNVADDTTD